MTRESLVVRTMVELADTLVDDFDIVDLLTTLSERCVDILDAAAAGIMLAAPGSELRSMVSSSETMRIVELFELQAQQGPCFDCYRTGQPVINDDLTAPDQPWPEFAAVAVDVGFLAADAIPLRLRANVIGALNLFRTKRGSLGQEDLAVAQALADVATIAILQHRQTADTEVINRQLATALESRIVIEQAKGVIAERHAISTDDAFGRLRKEARNHNRRLVDLARQVVEGAKGSAPV
jgi:GAF domain-containing protein